MLSQRAEIQHISSLNLVVCCSLLTQTSHRRVRGAHLMNILILYIFQLKNKVGYFHFLYVLILRNSSSLSLRECGAMKKGATVAACLLNEWKESSSLVWAFSPSDDHAKCVSSIACLLLLPFHYALWIRMDFIFVNIFSMCLACLPTNTYLTAIVVAAHYAFTSLFFLFNDDSSSVRNEICFPPIQHQWSEVGKEEKKNKSAAAYYFFWLSSKLSLFRRSHLISCIFLQRVFINCSVSCVCMISIEHNKLLLHMMFNRWKTSECFSEGLAYPLHWKSRLCVVCALCNSIEQFSSASMSATKKKTHKVLFC